MGRSTLDGNTCIVIRSHWTMIGACGPYNLGGSTTKVHRVVVIMAKLDPAYKGRVVSGRGAVHQGSSMRSL